MSGSGQTPTNGRRVARRAAALFLLLAVAGFTPGLTADLGRIELAGCGSGAALFGIIHVTVAGNLIHLTMGCAGWLAAESEQAAQRFLVWGGSAYAAVSCYALVVARLVADTQPVPDRGAAAWLPVALGLTVSMTGLWVRRLTARDVRR